jgi:CheY-like chemotaxis protein
MPTRSALTIVDAIAEETTRIRVSAPDATMRAQAAFVRALVDEVGRHHPSRPDIAPLHAQLGDELWRLARLHDPHEAPTAERLEVLVVDDDEPSLRAMVSIVRDLGYRCRTAGGAEEALLEFERRPAGIVLSDWNLPGMSGLDLCRELKQRDPHVYVVLVTAHDEVSQLEGVHGGIDDFLRKPVDVDELVARLTAAEQLVRAMRVVERVRDRLQATAGASQA